MKVYNWQKMIQRCELTLKTRALPLKAAQGQNTCKEAMLANWMVEYTRYPYGHQRGVSGKFRGLRRGRNMRIITGW